MSLESSKWILDGWWGKWFILACASNAKQTNDPLKIQNRNSHNRSLEHTYTNQQRSVEIEALITGLPWFSIVYLEKRLKNKREKTF